MKHAISAIAAAKFEIVVVHVSCDRATLSMSCRSGTLKVWVQECLACDTERFESFRVQSLYK
jgi:hypothetical protein